MHELTLAERAIGIAENTAKQAGAARITRIRLGIGTLSHIEPEAMRYCCGLVSRGTLADGAVIEVESRSGRAICQDCKHEIRLDRIGEACPHCGSYRLDVVDGDRMVVIDIGVA